MAKGYSEYEEAFGILGQLNTNEGVASKHFDIVKNYQQYSNQEIMQAVKGLHLGTVMDDSYGMPRRVTISPDPDAAVRLLRYLVESRNHVEAGAFAGRYYLGSHTTIVLPLLEYSASIGSPDALGRLGEYYACLGRTKEGLELLEKSKVAGYEYAVDGIEEIREIGEPANCGDIRN